MKKPPPKAILFDADGTLYNSERLHFKSTRLTAKQLHGFDFTWELFETHMLKGTKSGHEVLLDHGFDSDNEQYRITKQAFFERLVAEELTTLPGLVGFLDWCAGKSIKLAIVSGSLSSHVRAALAAVGISDYFDVVIAGEHVSGNKKPHPHPYLSGLKLLKVGADRAIAVEDTAKGIASAKAAGLFCIGIRNDTNDDTDLTEADHVIADYDELRNYLLS